MDATNEQVLQAIYELFEWTFEVSIPDEHRAWIEQTIVFGWHNGDPSDQELIAYLVQLHAQVFNGPFPVQDGFRPQVQHIFRVEFARPELNDRGRILTSLHFVLEQLRPGCTQVASLHAPQAAAQVPPHAGVQTDMAPGYAQPMGMGYPQPGMPPGMPYGQPPAPPMPPQQAAQPIPGVPDMLQVQMDAQRRRQMVQLQSDLAKMHHDSMMGIIKNL